MPRILAAGMLMACCPGVAARLDTASRSIDTPLRMEAPGREWLDTAGRPSPLHSDAEMLEYLRTARVVSGRRLAEGVGGALKLLLDKDGIRMHAVFRHLRERRSTALPTGRVLDQRDDYLFEPAAFELSRMLGLDNVPPAVVRSIDGKEGSLQVWIERSFTEKRRLEEHRKAPDEGRIRLEYEIMGVFDNLIYNDDRNRGNILFDSNWKLWMIDHTRAFRPNEELPYPNAFRRCESDLWQRLKRIDEAELRARMAHYLEPAQIHGLVQRLKAVIERIEMLIEDEGESAVLFRLRPKIGARLLFPQFRENCHLLRPSPGDWGNSSLAPIFYRMGE